MVLLPPAPAHPRKLFHIGLHPGMILKLNAGYPLAAQYQRYQADT